MPEVKPSEVDSVANIKVVGVGGAGCNAVNRMREAGLTGVELVAINTDAQQLRSSKADVKVIMENTRDIQVRRICLTLHTIWVADGLLPVRITLRRFLRVEPSTGLDVLRI